MTSASPQFRLVGRLGGVAAALGVSVAGAAGYQCSSAWPDSIINELGPATRLVSSEMADPLVSDANGASSEFLALINGVSPAPSTPGDYVGYSGDPSLSESVTVGLLDAAAPVEKALGIDFESTIAPLIASDSPPPLVTLGLTVTESNYDGMPVYDLTAADPSGQYVVAVHGGSYVDEPTIFHWLDYAEMAQQTGATVVVPIYPLAPQGTAATVEPEIANLISAEIAAEGAGHVSVYGDSAGGGMALSAVELLVSEGKPVPESMVLDSPTLDLALDNPSISSVDDPILNLAELQQDGLLWAGDLPLTNPLVSPIDGSLDGLPPTYVYSGSDDLLAPDVLALEKDAIAQDAPISFILRSGEIHDWALVPLLDGAQVQPQIYQELGLTDAAASAATGGSDVAEAAGALSTMSTDLTGGLATMTTEATGLSADLSALVADAFSLF